MSLRNERVRKELMRDISDIIRKEIRGLEGVVSIVDVEVSHDNSFAKVIYSILGSDEQIEKDKENFTLFCSIFIHKKRKIKSFDYLCEINI